MNQGSLLQLNAKLLKVAALYPLDDNAHFVTVIAVRLYKLITIVSLYCVVLPCAYEICLGQKSKITDYSMNIMNTGAYLCSILTLHFFLVRSETGRKLVTEMNQHFKYSTDSINTKTSMENMDKRTRKITIGFISLLTSGVFFMALFPLILPGRVLPIPGVFPFNWTETPNYQLTFGLQFYAQMVIGYVTSASDAFFICMVLLAAEQFKVLGSDFNNCLYKALSDAGFSNEAILNFKNTLGTTETKNNLRSSKQFPKNSTESNTTQIDPVSEKIDLIAVIQTDNFQRKLSALMINCIKHHQMLLNFCVKVEDLFWPLILMKVATSMFYHIFITFAMVTSTDPAMAFILAQYEVCAITELFIFSLAGQALIDESENVREELCKSPWYYCNHQYKKTLIMILMRCDRPSGVTVGKLVNMSLPTFIMIMKTAFSYFAVLRQVTE